MDAYGEESGEFNTCIDQQENNIVSNSRYAEDDDDGDSCLREATLWDPPYDENLDAVPVPIRGRRLVPRPTLTDTRIFIPDSSCKCYSKERMRGVLKSARSETPDGNHRFI